MASPIPLVAPVMIATRPSRDGEFKLGPLGQLSPHDHPLVSDQATERRLLGVIIT